MDLNLFSHSNLLIIIMKKLNYVANSFSEMLLTVKKIIYHNGELVDK